MSKRKRKLTAREKREKKRRREEYMTNFVHGKQERVKRPTTIDGMDVDDWIRQNADPIWLHQNGSWEYIEPEPGGEWLDGLPPKSPGDDARPYQERAVKLAIEEALR